MTGYGRYAIYYAPRQGAFADAMAAWLGWDVARGQAVACRGPEGLPRPQADLTRAPRKYGFHGTIKAPFRLAEGATAEDLDLALRQLAGRLQPVRHAGLRLQRIKGFLALLPEGCESELLSLGAEVVTALDPLRAPLTAAEIARRRPETLSSRQRDLLDLWGYPYVMEEFRFHLTLTDNLERAEAEAVEARLAPWLAPVLPSPFVIEDLCLFGEDGEGRFHLLHRYALGESGADAAGAG